MGEKHRNLRMVPKLVFGRGSFDQLGEILETKRNAPRDAMIFLIDDVFEGKSLEQRIPHEKQDRVIRVNVKDEPSTALVDNITQRIREDAGDATAGIVGIGGGSVMDIAKAVSVMLTNPGSSSEYQGWDIVKNPSLYHMGIPTLSGTGAEASRTAVLIGPERKLGINSDFSVFDQILLDPDLLEGVPREQRFYTGMDCYIHCVESLEGTFINAFSRAYAEKAMDLCREVFLNQWQPESDEKLMTASLFGGLSIAYSQVGVCHALSYGLSYVLKVHHGIGNSIVFDYLDDFYPDYVKEFKEMCRMHEIQLPRGITKSIPGEKLTRMVDIALSLDPLWENALGAGWKNIMTGRKARQLYEMM